jgi:D-sedoheptulose 7-phosphate isomerase
MPGTICSTARDYLSKLNSLIAQIDPVPIDALADRLFQAWQARQRVFTFGNGGSASTASHIVCDLVKTACVPGQPRLDVLCLSDNIPLLTALGNDDSYDEVFRFPLESFAKAGDVAIAVSCSGNSPNLLRGAEWAKANGLTLAALTGFAGGKIKALADIHINIPSDNYGLVEDLHLSVDHMITQRLKSRIEKQRQETSCKS